MKHIKEDVGLCKRLYSAICRLHRGIKSKKTNHCPPLCHGMKALCLSKQPWLLKRFWTKEVNAKKFFGSSTRVYYSVCKRAPQRKVHRTSSWSKYEYFCWKNCIFILIFQCRFMWPISKPRAQGVKPRGQFVSNLFRPLSTFLQLKIIQDARNKF